MIIKVVDLKFMVVSLLIDLRLFGKYESRVRKDYSLVFSDDYTNRVPLFL